MRQQCAFDSINKQKWLDPVSETMLPAVLKAIKAGREFGRKLKTFCLEPGLNIHFILS